METLNDSDRQAVPEPVGGAIPPPACSDSSVAETTDRGLQRIEEYLTEALAKHDGLEANIGAANANLMFLAHRLHQSLKLAMAHTPVAPDEYEQLLPTIDGFLRVNKQIDRLAQLSSRLQAARRRGWQMKVKARSILEKGEASEVGQPRPSEELAS